MKEQWMQKTGVVWFLAMICCLLWGSAFPCIKIGYKMFHIASADASSQLLFAGCRFFLAGFLVLLLGTSGKYKLKKTEIPMAMILAVFQTILQYVFFYMGLAHATGVKSSIINGAEFLSGYFNCQPYISSGKADRTENYWLCYWFCRSGSC